MSSISIIGGADGPTSIFLAGKIGFDFGWLNLLGLILVVLLLVPNIIYAVKAKNQHNQCTNKAMNLLEQIGRYGSMFFLVFHIGIAELGFGSVESFLLDLAGSAVLLIAYWVVWMLYFSKPSYQKQMALAILPTCLFLLNGVAMRNYLLILFSVIFGIGHLYVTNKNTEVPK